MFSLNQINNIHEQLGNLATLADYLIALRKIGVEKYDTYISDGHSEYFGKDNRMIISPAIHERFSISDVSDKENLLVHLKLHEEGKTDYFKMTKGLADSGIEKWTFDTNEMTIVYYSLNGDEMLIEKIEQE